MKIKDLDILIELSEKKTSLLKELKESIIFESKMYNLVQTDSLYKKHTLYKICDKKPLVSGEINIIKSYINLRNIDIDTIYCTNKILI